MKLKLKVEFQKFLEDRIAKQTTGFFDTPKRLHLGPFTSVLKKSVKIKSDVEVLQFSVQSDIFWKIALIQPTGQLDLKKVFYYPLGRVLWSLSNKCRSARLHKLHAQLQPCMSRTCKWCDAHTKICAQYWFFCVICQSTTKTIIL